MMLSLLGDEHLGEESLLGTSTLHDHVWAPSEDGVCSTPSPTQQCRLSFPECWAFSLEEVQESVFPKCSFSADISHKCQPHTRLPTEGMERLLSARSVHTQLYFSSWHPEAR